MSGVGPHKARQASRRALWDALIAALIVLAGALCFMALEATERITDFLVPFERFELDDLLLGSVLGVLATSWFAIRRWRDALRELRARQLAERDVAQYVNKLERLSAQLLQTEQGERARLAELLHDHVGQTLFACRLQLDRVAPHVTQPELSSQLAEARALATSAMEQARDLTIDLRPPVLDDLGLCAALEWLTERSRQRWHLAAEVVPADGWLQIPIAWHEPLFHSVSELVANAAKHAAATRVEVSLEPDAGGGLKLCVRDDGRGFDAAASPRSGFGLLSIERRMACLGGRLSLQSAPGRGTAAILELPAAGTA